MLPRRSAPLARRCTRAQVPPAIRRRGVRWSVSPPPCGRVTVQPSGSHGGVQGAPSTSHRGVGQDGPQLAAACPRCPRPVWGRWRMAATSRSVPGERQDGCRAVDTSGAPLAVLRTAHRAPAAACRVLQQAIRWHGVPETRTSAGRAAPATARTSANAAPGTSSAMRPVTAGKTVGAPAQRAGKRRPRPRRGCQACAAAPGPRAGVARRPRLTQRQRVVAGGGAGLPAAA